MRVFRSYKTVDRKVRPVHQLEGRVRAHIFLCMLAYHVERHMAGRSHRCSSLSTAPRLCSPTSPR